MARRRKATTTTTSGGTKPGRRTTTTGIGTRRDLFWCVALLLSCWTIQTTRAASLLNGRYETTNDVTEYLNLALDASKMSESNSFDVTLGIYKNGHAPGNSNNPVTLQSLSLTSEETMKENPFYHMFRYAFWDMGYNREGEDDGLFDGSPVQHYADTVVQDLFALDVPEIESDAALVMNVWMASVNGVFQAMAHCKAKNGDAGLVALDRAVALWVGAGQEEGSNEKGHLLYNLAENAGERFDQDDGEAAINTHVMNGFAELQTALQGGACDGSSAFDRYAAMRTTVYWLTGIMTVPLVQNLIHHTMNIENEGGSNLVELYALGIIPRVATCDPRAYDALLRLDVLNDLGENDAEKAIEAIQGTYPCLGLTCRDVGSYMGGEIPECSDINNDAPFQRGGYVATSRSARSKANIDRDVLQIDAFLKYGAKDLAYDFYKYGWNSDVSLKRLAVDDFVPSDESSSSSYFSLYSSYNGGVALNDKITGLLRGTDETFVGGTVSDEQFRTYVTGLLRYAVVFVTTADSLKHAAEECVAGDTASANSFVDASAMFFVGSMEDETTNPTRFHDGKSLFALAQDLCTDFGTCIRSGPNAGGARVNVHVVQSLATLQEVIGASDCDEAHSLVEDTILPALAVPLVQGLLKQAHYNEKLSAGTHDAGLANADALARSILPLIAQKNPGHAEFLEEETRFQLTAQPVSSGFKYVADAFRKDTLAGMGIECSQVGTLAPEPVAGAMCGDGVTPPRVTPPAKVGFGRYVFSDPAVAAEHAAFALDVRDVFDAATPEDGASIYAKGANALSANAFGDGVGGTPSLASLSTLAGVAMRNDPVFNVYKYALYEDGDFDDLSDEDFAFANDIVVEALNKGDNTKLAAESAVILHVFMVIAHKLYASVRECELGISPESSIDASVALWIGDLQGEGKFDDGWMMYSIGQSVQKFFGFPEGEAPVNSILMDMFVEAQTAARECSTDSVGSATALRFVSHEIIRLLTKPLIKSLLFHMVKNSKNMVELYAVAVIPQCAACDPEVYESLQSAFFSGYSADTSLTDDVLDDFAAFLSCQRITCESLQTGDDAEEKLVDLVGKLCQRLGDDPNTNSPIAGYVPQYSVNEVARLDLDALEIDIMMRTRAYAAAEDIYKFGHNSGSSDGTTLESFAGSRNQEVSADGIILEAMHQRREYSSATRGEAAEIVKRTLQSMVSYNAVLAKMESAIDKCESRNIDTARQEWDKAVAFYAGSMEGTMSGSKADRHGVWMYALGNEFCADFGTCETSGEAAVDEQLMFHFTSGRDSMVDGECDHLKSLVSKSITPKLLIPHIQGIISSSIKINSGLANKSEFLAAAHVLSQTVTPSVGALSSESESLLSNTFGSFSAIPSSPAVSDIVSAFSEALQGLGIACDAIGNPTGYSLCDTSSSSSSGDNGLPVEENPTKLAGDLYVTTSYVQDRANIALDLKDMSEALAEGNSELAKLIYSKGKNSEKYDDNGKFVHTRTFKGFSTKSTDYMFDEPEFNMFMYTYGNQLYADELVEEALTNSKIANPDVATEGAMVLNLWMEIVHLMHETLQACKNKQLVDGDGVFLMDSAVAYWIGDGQIAGDGDNGHLLYALSERLGEAFNIEIAGQSRTNTNILRLFNEAKNEVSLPNACSGSQYTYTKLRGIVNRLIPQMAVPLIQGFILALRANDRERVKIYSRAYVPLVSGCSPSLFQDLRYKLFSNDEYNVVDVEPIIALIRKSYDCLGLKCDDVGVHNVEKTNSLPECQDPDIDAHLAGYRPASDVREYSRFDLDIREMDILLQMNAYDAVKELYTYGKHVRGANGVSISIGQLATTKHRSVVPEFDNFVRYYSTDTYADDIIRAAIDSSKLDFDDNWTDGQRRTVVIKATQVLVMYFAALQNAYEAVTDCEAQKGKSTRSSDSWDRTAALLIGSLEGTAKNGTVDGYMFYDLAQQHCKDFGTCVNDDTYVHLNEELITLLYTGRGAALSNSCRALEKAADEISRLLLIPVIQGALSNSMVLSTEQDLQKRAEAYVYGRALVPFVRKRDAANDVDFYLGNPAPSDKKHTAMKIYAALATAYPNMNIDCEDVGIANGIDTCSGVVYVSDYIWIVVGVTIGFLLACVCALYFFCTRRRRKSSKAENNPRFFPSNGELNHSMDLLEKAFSTRRSLTPDSSHGDTDEEIEALNRKYIDSRSEDLDHPGETFSDEDDELSDHFHEVVALTSGRDLIPDII